MARFITLKDYELPNERRIRINQLRSTTVSQLFKFEVGSVFLVERFSEKTIFPEEDGTFSIGDDDDFFNVEGQRISTGMGSSNEISSSAFHASPTTFSPLRPPAPLVFPRLPGVSHTPTPPPVSRHAQRSSFIVRFRRAAWDVSSQLVDLNRVRPQIIEILARENDLNVSSLRRLIAEECQRLDASPDRLTYSIFRKDGSEVYDCEATRQKDYWHCQGRNGIVWFIAPAPSATTGNSGLDDSTDHRRRPSQAEVLLEIKRFKRENKEANDDIRATLQTALRTNQKDKDVAGLIASLLTCNMCDGFMEKPCICRSCQNVIGCKECLDKSHNALNEVREDNEYGPVDPMCPLCRENSRPFLPIQILGFQEIAAALRRQF